MWQLSVLTANRKSRPSDKVGGGGYLAPYLQLARCDLAALCALARDPLRRMHLGEGAADAPTRSYF